MQHSVCMLYNWQHFLVSFGLHLFRDTFLEIGRAVVCRRLLPDSPEKSRLYYTKTGSSLPRSGEILATRKLNLRSSAWCLGVYFFRVRQELLPCNLQTPSVTEIRLCSSTRQCGRSTNDPWRRLSRSINSNLQPAWEAREY